MEEEGRFSLLLGEEAQEEEAEGSEAPVAPLDPSAAALAMGAAAQDPRLAASAAAYFDKQTRLVGLQAEHLHEQREVQLSHLRLKRMSERLKIGSQLFLIAGAALLAVYLGIMLHDAVTSRVVIVEPFDAPPALAARGLTGTVVAGALLDQLIRLQAVTQSSATKRELANSWTGEIKVEVPETGLSLSDIDRLLKSRFGNDLHIGGDLVQTETGGLQLTVRGDGVLPKLFTGGPGDLDRLMVAAGEYVYGQTQPALFAVYLARTGRFADAVAFDKSAVLTAAPGERPYILNAWASALTSEGGSVQEALSLENAALALKPDYWTAYTNAALDARSLGDEEGAWQTGEAMQRAAGGRPGRAPDSAYSVLDWLTYNLLAGRAAVLADAELHAGVGSTTTAASPEIAGVDTDLHDFADADLRLKMFDLSDPYAAAMLHYVRGRMAQEAGDTATALREMEAWGAANANPAVSQGDTSYHCLVAPAEEAAGHRDRADAELRAGGNFVDCYRFHADALDGRGDWPAAQAAYDAAVRLAPDLPSAYYSWGMALARHNDLPGAISKFAAAAQRGPHWADPLKAWGDVLARQGNWAAARAKYKEALAYAPAWDALRRAYEDAVKRPE
jgi:tetratricopeptide (TPR) repeat protein